MDPEPTPAGSGVRRAAPSSLGAGSLTTRAGVAQGNSDPSRGWPPRFSRSAVCACSPDSYGSWLPRVSRSEIRRVSIFGVFLSRGWPPGLAPRSSGTEDPSRFAHRRERRVRAGALGRWRRHGGAGRGPQQVLRGPPAGGRQRGLSGRLARSTVSASGEGRRVARGDVRARDR